MTTKTKTAEAPAAPEAEKANESQTGAEQQMTPQQMVARCKSAVLDVLNAHGCRLIARWSPPEAVGDGDKLLMTTQVDIVINSP